MKRSTWQEVVELSPAQVRTRRILLTLIPVLLFVSVLAGIGLLGWVTR